MEVLQVITIINNIPILKKVEDIKQAVLTPEEDVERIKINADVDINDFFRKL